MEKIDIEENKQHIIFQLKRTENLHPEMDKFLVELEKSDFFTAPASTGYHLAVKGGLAQHSINVFELLFKRMKYHYGKDKEQWPFPFESVIFIPLLHDICKIGLYEEGAAYPATDAQLYTLEKSFHEVQLKMEDEERFLTYCLDEDDKWKKNLSKDTVGKLITWLKDNPMSHPMPELKETWRLREEEVDPLGHGEKSLSILQDWFRLTSEEKLAIRWHMAGWDLSPYYGTKAFDKACKQCKLVPLIHIVDYEATHMVDLLYE
jgi:hypothetical protein